MSEEGGQVKPNAIISSPGDSTYVETGVDVSFDGSTSYDPDGGDPEIKSYSWDFGDGAYDTAGATSDNAICKYSTAGVKTITLTVTDNDHAEGYPYDQTDSDTCCVKVLHIEITEPNDNPVTDNHFTFNSASPAGVCDVTIAGTTGETSEDTDLEWTLTAIAGPTQQTSIPSPAKGAGPTFTYTTLPSSWNDFGDKTLTLSHPSVTSTDTKTVQIFFTQTATNHDSTGSDTSPNWYYYWKQTSANSGSHTYNSSIGYDGQYTLGRNYFEIGPSAKDADRGYYVDGSGIDNFASTCRHEERHMNYFLSTWGSWNNYQAQKATQDLDLDLLKDSDEAGLGYDSTKLDTDGNGSDDFEDLACKAEATWINGSANSKDWANPGKQSNF